MNFDEIILLDFIEGIPRNAIVYIFAVEEDNEIKQWSHQDWGNIRYSYYNNIDKPEIAWLHDIFKNRCKYNRNKFIYLIKKLYKNIQ